MKRTIKSVMGSKFILVASCNKNVLKNVVPRTAPQVYNYGNMEARQWLH